MLIILSTHPIQYQVPLWQALARDGRVPFEVWYLSDHGTRVSHDKEFGTNFAWDLDMLTGYPHQFLKTPPNVTPASFWKCRASEPLAAKLRVCGAKALWIQGWQVAGYWQAVNEARKAGVKVWLRGESNDLAPPAALWKQWVKRVLLGWLFGRVDKFLCIGRANRRLYESYGIGPDRLLQAPYCVDNERFGRQKAEMEKQKAEIRKRWGIADDAFCVLFCGKFIPKKRPMDLVKAAALLIENKRLPNLHLLFTGSGELGPELRAACDVVYDAANASATTANREPRTENLPPASFAGFLNQTQISEAYVAADCLVLPSDYGETWGLVVNEAMASGLPCVISDRCGSAEDLGAQPPNQTFPFGDCNALADRLCKLAQPEATRTVPPQMLDGFSFQNSVQTVTDAYVLLK